MNAISRKKYPFGYVQSAWSINLHRGPHPQRIRIKQPFVYP